MSQRGMGWVQSLDSAAARFVADEVAAVTDRIDGGPIRGREDPEFETHQQGLRCGSQC